ncbi:MAG: TlpA disulfide reductase family protein [Actinobacteria bacterium]|nr:TlpA disulfide reductase family protein [Actinomycetota bacterium]
MTAASGQSVSPRGGSKLARNAAIIVGILLVAFIALLATRGTSTPISSRIVGQAAPDFSGTTLDGSTFRMANHRGEWVLVNFFATWCTPCRLEDPQIQQFVDSHKADPVKVVSVAFSDDASSISAYWVKERNTWPVISTDTGLIALDYGVTKVPESYMVAPSGLVVAGFFGGVTASGLDKVIADNGGMTVAGTGTK